MIPGLLWFGQVGGWVGVGTTLVTRSWTDRNGGPSPDCHLRGLLLEYCMGAGVILEINIFYGKNG